MATELWCPASCLPQYPSERVSHLKYFYKKNNFILNTFTLKLQKVFTFRFLTAKFCQTFRAIFSFQLKCALFHQEVKLVSRYCFLSHSFAVSFVCMYFLDFYYYLRKSIIIILFFLTYRLYPYAFMWISCLLDVVFYPKQRLTSRKFDLCQNL